MIPFFRLEKKVQKLYMHYMHSCYALCKTISHGKKVTHGHELKGVTIFIRRIYVL